ncbi:MAG: flippase [Candidatus Moraniibacteriota bacterium]|nr:MAG: flippase [Candidatus Moranbacteria bacterium]
MPLARRIAYNVVFNSVAKIASTVLALVAIGFITRYLGTEGFGNYATVLAFFGLFAALADFGLSPLLTREISRKDAPEQTIVGNVVALRIASSSFILGIALIAVPFLPYDRELRIGIIIAAIAFVFASSSGILNGIFQKRLAMFEVATVEFLGKCLQLGIIVAAVSFDWGFGAIVLALLAYMVFNAVSLFFLSQRLLSFHLSFDVSFWKNFLRESLPVGMISIVSFAYFKMDTILLSILQGSADVGIYNAAYKIIENLTFFPAMIAGLILPLFSRYIFHEPEKFRLVADKTFKVFVVFAAPIAIGGFFLAEPLVLLIGGPDFLAAALPLRILIFSLAAIFFGNFFNAILIAGNLQKRLLVLLSVVAFFNIIANLLLIPQYSFVGAASVSLATEAAVALGTAFLALRFLEYRPDSHGIVRILLSSVILGIFLFVCASLPFIVRLLGGIAVYLIALWSTGGISMDEIAPLLFRKSAPREDIETGSPPL